MQSECVTVKELALHSKNIMITANANSAWWIYFPNRFILVKGKLIRDRKKLTLIILMSFCEKWEENLDIWFISGMFVVAINTNAFGYKLWL